MAWPLPMDWVGRNSHKPTRSGLNSHTRAGRDMVRIVAFALKTISFPVRTFMPIAPMPRFLPSTTAVSSAVASVRSKICTPRRFSSLYNAGLKVEPHTRSVNLFV